MLLLRNSLSILLALIFVSACTHAINHQPNLEKAAQSRAALGLALLKEGKTAAAKQQLLVALKQAKTNVIVLDSMAFYFEQQGRVKLAKHYYEKALAQKNHAGVAANNFGAFLCRQKHYRLGIAYFVSAAHEPNYLFPKKAYQNAALCAEKIPDNMLAKRYKTLSKVVT